MALTPQTFRTASERVVQYSFTDIASGTGYVLFYGANSKANTTEEYFLTPNVIKSNDIATEASFSNASPTKELDLDFDVQLLEPRIMQGIAFVSVPFGLNSQTTTTSGYVIVKVRKWDGTTETEIANTQSETLSGSGNSDLGRPLLVQISIPKTNFKVNDYIRITIEAYGNGDGAGWHRLSIGHDPAGRTGWTDGSANETAIFDGDDKFNNVPILQVLVPFRVTE